MAPRGSKPTSAPKKQAPRSKPTTTAQKKPPPPRKPYQNGLNLSKDANMGTQIGAAGRAIGMKAGDAARGKQSMGKSKVTPGRKR